MDNRSHFRSLDELIRGLDRERALERTTSTGDMDKFQEAICAKNGGDNVPCLSPVLSQVGRRTS